MRLEEAQQLAREAAPIVKVGAVTGAAVATSYVDTVAQWVSILSMTAALIYTSAKLYELFTGRKVKDLWRR